jgi:hypothetical protein
MSYGKQRTSQLGRRWAVPLAALGTSVAALAIYPVGLSSHGGVFQPLSSIALCNSMAGSCAAPMTNATKVFGTSFVCTPHPVYGD